MKNINSFNFVKKAIEYEVDRQIEILEKSDTSQEHTFLETESEGEEEPKKVLH